MQCNNGNKYAWQKLLIDDGIKHNWRQINWQKYSSCYVKGDCGQQQFGERSSKSIPCHILLSGLLPEFVTFSKLAFSDISGDTRDLWSLKKCKKLKSNEAGVGNESNNKKINLSCGCWEIWMWETGWRTKQLLGSWSSSPSLIFQNGWFVLIQQIAIARLGTWVRFYVRKKEDQVTRIGGMWRGRRRRSRGRRGGGRLRILGVYKCRIYGLGKKHWPRGIWRNFFFSLNSVSKKTLLPGKTNYFVLVPRNLDCVGENMIVTYSQVFQVASAYLFIKLC